MQGSTISYPHRDCMIKSILSQVISKCKHIFVLLLTSCDKNYRIVPLSRQYRQQKGGETMVAFFSLIQTVIAGVVTHIACKFVDIIHDKFLKK